MVDGALHSVVVHDVLAIYVYVRGCLLYVYAFGLLWFWLYSGWRTLAAAQCVAMCECGLLLHTHRQARVWKMFFLLIARALSQKKKKNNAQKLFFFYLHTLETDAVHCYTILFFVI